MVAPPRTDRRQVLKVNLQYRHTRGNVNMKGERVYWIAVPFEDATTASNKEARETSDSARGSLTPGVPLRVQRHHRSTP